MVAWLCLVMSSVLLDW